MRPNGFGQHDNNVLDVTLRIIMSKNSKENQYNHGDNNSKKANPWVHSRCADLNHKLVIILP